MISNKINIAIADDEQLFREGIRFILEREANFNVIFEAENGLELINFLKRTTNKPDIVVTDLKMPELNGVETTEVIRREFPEIKIIALSSYATKSFIESMIKVGASSYLIKNSHPKTVVKTINEVFDKGFYYDEKLLEIINTSPKKLIEEKDELSKREKEVLALICKEFTTKEIAEKLFISPRTVDGHRNNLLVKTGVKNIAGLVIYAIQKRIVTLNDNLNFD